MQSAREEIRDLERVRYVTENYENLQGLTRVPIGLALLAAWAFFLVSEFEISSQPVADVFIASSLLVSVLLILIFFRIKRYYARRYGIVRVFPSAFSRRRLLAGLVGFVCVLAASLVALWVGIAGEFTPLPSVFIIIGLMETVDRWPERRFRPHYVFASLLMIFSGLALFLLTIFGVHLPSALILHSLFTFVILILVGGGILDHSLLVRTMKRLPDGDDGRAV